MPASASEQAMWYSTFTLMHYTSPNKRQSQGLVATCSWETEWPSDIHVISQIMLNVIVSAADAVVGWLSLMGKWCSIWMTHEAFGHSQSLAIFVLENACKGQHQQYSQTKEA
jgi:hypothetical protein